MLFLAPRNPTNQNLPESVKKNPPSAFLAACSAVLSVAPEHHILVWGLSDSKLKWLLASLTVSAEGAAEEPFPIFHP